MELKITVITVCYNAEKEIEKTLKSVLGQTFHPFEYLIIDGKSHDNTVEIAESYRSQFERKGIRYVVLSEKDTGIYNAMNKGLRIARGDFISFLNVGDWYQPDALSKINNFYHENPFDLTYGGLNYILPNGNVVVKMSRLDKILVSSRNWNHPSMFLRRELYEEYGFDESFPVYADFNLYIKLRKSNIIIRVIPEIITNFAADGISTDVNLNKVLSRAKEKYRAYRLNHYSSFYWFEAYGWEIAKMLYLKMKR